MIRRERERLSHLSRDGWDEFHAELCWRRALLRALGARLFVAGLDGVAGGSAKPPRPRLGSAPLVKSVSPAARGSWQSRTRFFSRCSIFGLAWADLPRLRGRDLHLGSHLTERGVENAVETPGRQRLHVCRKPHPYWHLALWSSFQWKSWW